LDGELQVAAGRAALDPGVERDVADAAVEFGVMTEALVFTSDCTRWQIRRVGSSREKKWMPSSVKVSWGETVHSERRR
jgi:hypothetical protein